MKATAAFLREIKRVHGLKTDGDLHRLLGISRARISRYQKGYDAFGEETAVKVAEALHVSPAYILASIAAERAKRPDVRRAWESAAKAAASASMLLILFIYLINNGSTEGVELAFLIVTGNIHYTQSTLIIAFALAIAALWQAASTRTASR